MAETAAGTGTGGSVGAPFALRVGAVGHLDAAETPALAAAAARVVADLAAAAERLAAEARTLGLSAGAARPTLLSCLSPGPDQFIAAAARASGFALAVLVPFAAELYEKPFAPDARARFRTLLAGADAVLALDGRADTEIAADAAYAEAARTLLANADVLVAVWDAARKEKPGGTSHTVGLARRAGLPVIWIDAGNGALRLLAGAPGAAPAPYHAAALVRALAEGALLPKDAAERAALAAAMGRVAAEPAPTVHPGKADFARWQPAAVPGAIARLAAGVSADPARDKPLPDQAEPPGAGDAWRGIFERYARFNAWSLHHAGLYRRAQTLIYILAGAALSAAIAALYVHLALDAKNAHGVRAAGWWIAVLELAILAAILGLMLAGRRRRWHDRSLDYRVVAELLRAGAYLSLVGRSLPAAALAAAARAAPPDRAWVFAEAGLALRAAGPTALAASPAALAARRDYIAANLVADQIAYHRGKQARTHAREHALRLVSEIAFFATIAVVAYEIAAPFLHLPAPGWLGMGSGILPAIAWACYGIRSHLELEVVIARSAAMERHLTDVGRRLAALEGDALTLAALGALTLEAAEHMIGDVSGWALMFDVKPMEAA